MLYPNVQNMTSDKVNRYMLVIATAKCARKITDMMSEEREAARSAGKVTVFQKSRGRRLPRTTSMKRPCPLLLT